MSFEFSRRSFLSGTALVAGAPWLAACGSGDAGEGAACATGAVTGSLEDAGLVLDSSTGLLSKAPATSPSPAMARFIASSRFGLFMHFGMNTFDDTELGDGNAPASLYAPTTIDAEGWVRTAREGGIDHLLLVCKHHDGFCLWPTTNTDYTVARSGNPTDVVRAVSDACRRQGVRFGVYYSLWDRRWDNLHQCGEHTNWVYTPQQDAEYLSYMSQHLRELLSNYGEVVELWFDGAWAKPTEQWPLDKVYDLIKRLQPSCQVGFNSTMLDSSQIRFFPSDFRLQDPYLPAYPDPKLGTWKGRSYYLPWETTLPVNQHWFWHADDAKLRSLDELETIYYRAVGQGNALVLNSPADRNGVMRADNAARLAELRARLSLRPGGAPAHPVNLSPAARASATGEQGVDFAAARATSDNPDARWVGNAGAASWGLRQDFDTPTRVDSVVLREYADGTVPAAPYRIEAFVLEALVDGAWRTLATGGALGVSFRFDAGGLRMSALQVRITRASGVPSLTAFWAFAYPLAAC